MSSPPDVLVVDARFRRQPATTGVHHWASALLAELPAHGVQPREIAPAVGSGPRGHAWEQLVLPRLYRRERSALPLLSPCNWGPLAVREQALVLHDVAPLVVPQFFSRQYVGLARVQLPLLARAARLLVTVSEGSKDDIVRVLRVPASRVHVAGHGTRRLPEPDPQVRAALPRPYFAFVGAHDARKNLRFLVDLWPRVHAATGANLLVTRRTGLRTNVPSGTVDQPWYHELVSPSDEALAAVLEGATALLWPSLYEGFGMPLLEAYQLGTGVLSSDSGVARSLVVPPDEVLPLDADAWVAAVVARARAADGGAPPDRQDADRRARQQVAARHTWADVADRVVTALRS